MKEAAVTIARKRKGFSCDNEFWSVPAGIIIKGKYESISWKHDISFSYSLLSRELWFVVWLWLWLPVEEAGVGIEVFASGLLYSAGSNSSSDWSSGLTPSGKISL